ncbi:MAG: hypothetical protein AAGK02_01755 [Pseudomonadota bacterium]
MLTALRALALFTGDAPTTSEKPQGETHSDRTQRELKDALSKLQSLSGAA